MNTEPGQERISNKRADDPDKEVANNAKPSPTNDFAGQPSSDDPDQNDDQQAFV
jgi:hypothetical protein